MNVCINAFIPKYMTHRITVHIQGYIENCSPKYEYHGIVLFFNETLDLKEKKKVDISLGRAYLSQNKHVRTQTTYSTKMMT